MQESQGEVEWCNSPVLNKQIPYNRDIHIIEKSLEYRYSYESAIPMIGIYV